MRYETLDVELRTRTGGGYEARVTSTTSGTAREPCDLGLPVESAPRLVEALERTVWRRRLGREPGRELGGEGGEGHAPEEDDLPSPEELGNALFAAVFHGSTARVLDNTMGEVEASTKSAGEPRGLRIRFVFDPADAEHSALAILPWELLRRHEARRYLARSRHTPVVRSLDVPGSIRPLQVEGPVRVLLVEASPQDEEPLDTAAEAAAVRKALAAVPGIDVEHLRKASFQDLIDAVFDGEFHGVHFMGHARFDRDRGESLLCFEGSNGAAEPVPAGWVAEHLKEDPGIRLVVLNACATGALRRHEGQDPFSAAAAACLLEGLPAVVAMQFPISDPAAIAFAQGFYKALARRDPVDAAVARGRLAICSADPAARRDDFLEWATPVLYLRSRESQLFAAPSRPRPRTGEGERTEATPAGDSSSLRPTHDRRPLRLGIRSMEGHGVGLEEEAERTLSLVEHFEGRWIREPALWETTVLPELREFLAEAVATRRPLVLDLAAHQSLAFAAGSFLEAKSGVAISLVQRSQAGTREWPARPGEVPEGLLWQEPEDLPVDPEARDLAVAAAVTREVLDDVARYCERERLPVRRILHLSLPEPGPTAVHDGPHALRLAQTLAREVRRRPPEERTGTVHLFTAAPNGLLVFLGQLAPGLGPVQLYEYDFDTLALGGYRPSVRIPPEG
ncbi:MAG: SAVED domain-containing protein [Thermoanaerobaculia bacterium]